MLTETQLVLLASMMQSMAAMWGIVFAVYVFQWGYFERKSTSEKLGTGERYALSFSRIYVASVETLIAIVIITITFITESNLLLWISIGTFLASMTLMFLVIVHEITTSIRHVGWYVGGKQVFDVYRERIKKQFVETVEKEAQKLLGKPLDDALLDMVGSVVEELRAREKSKTDEKK